MIPLNPADALTLADTALALISGRRTAHKYTPGEMPEGVMDRALAAAHMAPNHKLTWPWRFTVVGPETREAIAQIAIKARAAKSGGALDEKGRQAIEEKIVNPAGLVVVTQRKCADAFRAKEDYAAVSCAIQNFALVIHAAGLASKWSTGSLTRLPEVRAAVGFNADEEDLVGFLWVGHPIFGAVVPRPPVEEMVRRLP